MHKFLIIFGLVLIIVTPACAIMSGNPVDVMKSEGDYNNGQLSLESNFIFESDISPNNSSNSQTEKGEWYLVKGAANINESVDLYVRLGVSHLEQRDKTRDIREELEWSFAFGGGAMFKIYEYTPWQLNIVLDAQYYGTLPDIKSVRIGSTTYTGGIGSKSYKEHNVQATLLSRMKAGPIFPYAGVVFAYRDISSKFTVNNTEYDLSGKNKNKVGLSVGFDFPFDLKELASGTGILSVEGRFFDEVGVNIALTNRF